ncbi:MAG: TlpA disulfide reductase family protein [Trueperaceae bacterium]|nr:TlpA disulfide reductase family protein [Trueperaceae bacterium]
MTFAPNDTLPARRLSLLRLSPRRLLSLVVATIAMAILALSTSVAVAQGVDRPPFGVVEGMTGPDFTMMSLEGEPVTLSDLRGRPVLVNFWASWCPPCVAELPLLDRTAAEASDQVRVVLLNVGEPHDVVAPFLARLEVGSAIVLRDARDEERPLPDGVVPSRAVAQVYETFGLPTSLLLDEEGVIRARISGPIDEPMLTALLRRVGVQLGDRAP